MQTPATSSNAMRKNVQVVVRTRPMSETERQEGCKSVVACDSVSKVVTLNPLMDTTKHGQRSFGPFDKVYGTESKQSEVYADVVKPLMKEVLSGYNCTVFAYGQTGSGKTYTMEGRHDDSTEHTWESDPTAGIIPRALDHIFSELGANEIDSYTVRASYVELYNEQIYDLLSLSVFSQKNSLRIFDDKNKGVTIVGAEEPVVRNRDEVYTLLKRGAEKRRTAATKMNISSSRSHSVFTVTVLMKEEGVVSGEKLLRQGKLNLVDLAGSENVGRSGAIEIRAREAGNINKSLLTLGRVITALTTNAGHIPYRESKLTRILQESLGGNTITTIIATLSPASSNFEESANTLEYAQQSKSVKNCPELNQKITREGLLTEYNEEIERLRRQLVDAQEKTGVHLDKENYDNMLEEIDEKTSRVKELEGELEAQVSRAEILSEENVSLKKELKSDLEARKILEKKYASFREKKVNQVARYESDAVEFRRQIDGLIKENTLLQTAKDKLVKEVDKVRSLEEENLRLQQQVRELETEGHLDTSNENSLVEFPDEHNLAEDGEENAVPEKAEKKTKIKTPCVVQVPAVHRKPSKIEIADDVLQKFLEWVPLRNLPNLITVDRRFWLYSDESLEARKHSITGLILCPKGLYVRRMMSNGRINRKRLPMAEVEPPQNFELKYLELKFGQANIEKVGEAMNFLRISKRLFVGALFRSNPKGCSMAVLPKLLNVFDKCSQITQLYTNGVITKSLKDGYFFTQRALLNCKRLELDIRYAPFDLNLLVEWLHTPPKSDANAMRQAYIQCSSDVWSHLLSLIKKKFSDDNIKHKFCIRFECGEYVQMENQRTGEILFTRIDNWYNSIFDIIRCGKGEQDSVWFEEIDRDKHPNIEERDIPLDIAALVRQRSAAAKLMLTSSTTSSSLPPQQQSPGSTGPASPLVTNGSSPPTLSPSLDDKAVVDDGLVPAMSVMALLNNEGEDAGKDEEYKLFGASRSSFMLGERIIADVYIPKIFTC